MLRMIRQVGGTVMSAPEDKILDAQTMLSGLEGIFVQPASATTLVALLELIEKGEIDSDARIVLILTGSGMKALGKIPLKDHQIFHAKLPDLPSVLKSDQSG